MAIEYNISENGLRIETFTKGELCVEETLDYFNRLTNDERIIPGATEIVYFNDVTDFKFKYSDASKITLSYQIPKSTKTIGATIFVCKTIQAYISGKMLQTYHKIRNPEHKVVVVRSEGAIENAINEL